MVNIPLGEVIANSVVRQRQIPQHMKKAGPMPFVRVMGMPWECHGSLRIINRMGPQRRTRHEAVGNKRMLDAGKHRQAHAGRHEELLAVMGWLFVLSPRRLSS